MNKNRFYFPFFYDAMKEWLAKACRLFNLSLPRRAKAACRAKVARRRSPSKPLGLSYEALESRAMLSTISVSGAVNVSNFPGSTLMPVRGALVELLDANTNAVISLGTSANGSVSYAQQLTGLTGDYAFSNVNVGSVTSVKIAVLAENINLETQAVNYRELNAVGSAASPSSTNYIQTLAITSAQTVVSDNITFNANGSKRIQAIDFGILSVLGTFWSYADQIGLSPAGKTLLFSFSPSAGSSGTGVPGNSGSTYTYHNSTDPSNTERIVFGDSILTEAVDDADTIGHEFGHFVAWCYGFAQFLPNSGLKAWPRVSHTYTENMRTADPYTNPVNPVLSGWSESFAFAEGWADFFPASAAK